jgi:hypothetical protein
VRSNYYQYACPKISGPNLSIWEGPNTVGLCRSIMDESMEYNAASTSAKNVVRSKGGYPIISDRGVNYASNCFFTCAGTNVASEVISQC